MTATGCDVSVLSDVRARRVKGGAAQHLLDAVLARCQAVGLLQPRGQQRSDATHVLAAVRTLNRVACGGETLRQALTTRAAVVPAGLRTPVAPQWYDRYGARSATTRRPRTQTELLALAATSGADGVHLRSAVYSPTAPGWLREIPAVQTLRRMWRQNYDAPDAATGVRRLRAAPDMPPGALLLPSPDDRDARFSTQRETAWSG